MSARHEPNSAFSVAAMEACDAVGMAVIDDHNSPGAVGVARMPMTARVGKRVTSADTYLPIEARPAGLTLLADTLVGEVVVRGGSASGVRLSDGRLIDAALVVLCAGVYGSPALLMRQASVPLTTCRR